METVRLIIAGGRDFQDYDRLEKECDHLLEQLGQPVEIVTGKARGTDSLGEQYAKNKGLPVQAFYPEWQRHGRSAGPIRNREMAQYATHLIAFWDGKSRGTRSMINLAKKKNLIVKVVSYSLSGYRGAGNPMGLALVVDAATDRERRTDLPRPRPWKLNIEIGAVEFEK